MLRFSAILKQVIFLTVIILVMTCANVKPALAHRPHDVISQIELSPNYGQDRTLFITVRNNLFKSGDGGETWRRINKGLDTQFFTPLSSLAIFSQNPKILFLSSEENGIYKSQDGGESWQKVNEGLDYLFTDILAVADRDPNLVLVAVGKERLGDKTKLYKTDDGGSKWSLVLDNAASITAIRFFQNDENHILVGDGAGNLYLSQDRGDTWKLVTTLKGSGAITSIATSANIAKDNTFFVGTEKGGIFQTIDGGKSFNPVNQGISDLNIRDIAIFSDSKDRYTVWVSTWNAGTFQSQDGGKTWKQYSQGLTKDSQADSLKSPHFAEFRISPGFKQDKTLFVGGFNGLFKSTDGGRNWREIETLSLGTITSLAVSPNYEKDRTLAIVTYVGNPRISNDGGKTWKMSNKGLEVPRLTKSFAKPEQDPRRFFDVAFSPNYASDRQIFATILWDIFLKSQDGGKAWKMVTPANPSGEPLRGMTILPSPNFATDRTIYLGTQYGAIFRSTDGGETFTILSKIERHSTNEPISLVASPNFASDRTLYAAGLQGVYKTVDAGETWKVTTEGTPLSERYNLRLAISPNYPADKTLLAGTERGLFITRNSGDSWEELKSPAYGEDAYIEDGAISPNYGSDRTFIVSTRGRGLFKTVDGGKTFTEIADGFREFSRMNDLPSAGIPIHFSPAYAKDKTIFGFGSAKTEVYKSTDGGNSWQILAVPTSASEGYDIFTQIELFFSVYRRFIIRLAFALVLAVFSYVFLGFLKLDKVLPVKKLTIKVVGTFLIFLIALIVLLK